MAAGKFVAVPLPGCIVLVQGLESALGGDTGGSQDRGEVEGTGGRESRKQIMRIVSNMPCNAPIRPASLTEDIPCYA